MSLLQEAETIIQKIKQQQYADLLSHDQLLMERKEQKVFLHFGKNYVSLCSWTPSSHCCLLFPLNILSGEGKVRV